jgi:hypothetical protein
MVVSSSRLTCISDNYSNSYLSEVSLVHAARELAPASTNNVGRRPFQPDSNSLDAARASTRPRMLPGHKGLEQLTQGEKTNPSSRMTGL